MADLFLHLAFARRLRLAEGLHPLIGESLARRPALVALGAALPHLPAVERKGMGFFLRLFARGSEAARWQKQLAPSSSPRAELVKRFALPTSDLGPLPRCSLAMGVLAYEVLAASTSSVAPSGAEGAAVERAQARLWLQAAVPNARDLESEWRPVADLADAELQRRAIDHVEEALKTAFGRGPGRETIARWMKGLVAEVAPAVEAGLPPSLGVADHVVRGPHFENNGFVARVQDAVNWFVVVANRVGERVENGETDAAALIDALCAGGSEVVQTEADATGRREHWQAWQQERRSSTLTRGRNDKPAFVDGVGEMRGMHRSNGFTGMVNLSDLPPSELPPELHTASLPPESASEAAPPMPAVTQEVSLAAIEAAAAAQNATGFAAPTRTQEVSLAQIEAESASFGAPMITQELTVSQIVAESPALAAPTATQELSLAQIEAVTDLQQPKPSDASAVPGTSDPPRE